MKSSWEGRAVAMADTAALSGRQDKTMARQLAADRLKRQQLSRSKAAWTVRKDDQREQRANQKLQTSELESVEAVKSLGAKISDLGQEL